MRELPLRYFGKIVGTAYVHEDGKVSGILDPELVSEEEVDAIFGTNYWDLSIHINVSEE